jgi:DNA polymerase III subunit beta
VKIQVPQNDLVRGLSAVANVVSSKTTLPILSTILFDAEGDALTLAATDLDVSVVTHIYGAEMGKTGRTAIPAAKFVPFIRTLGPDTVKLQCSSDKVKVGSGKARFEESTMDPADFPSLPKLTQDTSFEIEGEVLADMISNTIYAISRDETRPALQGVFWEITPKSFTMVATDGHRLTRTRRDLELGVKTPRKFIASSAGLQQVLRLVDDVEKVTVYVGESQLSFEVGNTTVHTRLVEGSFPNYEQVIPKNNTNHIVCDRLTLAERVKRVKISADRVTNQVRFEFEGGTMNLTATGTEGSRAEDQLGVDYEGDPLVIGFNHNYVEDVLKHLDTENVIIALDRADTAAIFVPCEGPIDDVTTSDKLCLLMPLRLND